MKVAELNKTLKVHGGVRLDTNKWYIDTDGFMRVPVVIAKTGVLDYTYQDGNDTAIVREAKLPEELLSQHTIFSAEGKPVTREHPPEMLDSSNFQKYALGTFINPKVIDGAIHGEIVVHDKELQKEIKDGKRYQVSPGFWSRTSFERGAVNGEQYDAVQRDIQINHIAIVEAGRAGDEVRVKTDSLQQIKNEVSAMPKSKNSKDGMTPEERQKIEDYNKNKDAGTEPRDESNKIDMENLPPEAQEVIMKLQEENSQLKDQLNEKPKPEETPEETPAPEEESLDMEGWPPEAVEKVKELQMKNEMQEQRLNTTDSKRLDTHYMEARDFALKYVADEKLDEYNNDADYYRRKVVEASGLMAKADSLRGGELRGAFAVAKQHLKALNTQTVDESRHDSQYKDELTAAREESLKLNGNFSGRRQVERSA